MPNLVASFDTWLDANGQRNFSTIHQGGAALMFIDEHERSGAESELFIFLNAQDAEDKMKELSAPVVADDNFDIYDYNW